MFAKRFFYACAGLLCLAVAYHLGAARAGAQSVVTYQETAMLSGEVADRGTIPLPHYQDGTEALESECTWIVSQKVVSSTFPPVWLRCSTTGRVVRVYACPSNCVIPGDCAINGCSDLYSATANYLIIAVRNSTPTPAKQTSLGALKVRYR
jgi:hypothetical protein